MFGKYKHNLRVLFRQSDAQPCPKTYRKGDKPEDDTPHQHPEGTFLQPTLPIILGGDWRWNRAWSRHVLVMGIDMLLEHIWPWLG
jgi:hypothetical protein